MWYFTVINSVRLLDYTFYVLENWARIKVCYFAMDDPVSVRCHSGPRSCHREQCLNTRLQRVARCGLHHACHNVAATKKWFMLFLRCRCGARWPHFDINHPMCLNQLILMILWLIILFLEFLEILKYSSLIVIDVS